MSISRSFRPVKRRWGALAKMRPSAWMDFAAACDQPCYRSGYGVDKYGVQSRGLGPRAFTSTDNDAL